jgi:hypothetical protein
MQDLAERLLWDFGLVAKYVGLEVLTAVKVSMLFWVV